MDFVRNKVDGMYEKVKGMIFFVTSKNPEVAHDAFVYLARQLHAVGLDKILLEHSTTKIDLPFELSNAAGFNKNGDVPPAFLEYLGFNRIVVGTVTCDPWKGNPLPRVKRYPQTKSLLNWMGLPGIGAKRVAENLETYTNNALPLTINLMGTPGKIGDALLLDLEGTMKHTAPYADRFELNISCKNTHAAGSKDYDARIEYQKHLDNMLTVVVKESQGAQVYVKVSPDMNNHDVQEIVDVLGHHKIHGITATNTTTIHLPEFIPYTPGKGGASGKAVKRRSAIIQDMIISEMNKKNMNLKMIACGGIDSVYEVKTRLQHGASGIQLYTPLIYEGPKLLTQIKKAYE